MLLARVARKLHLNRAAGYDALTIENIVYVLPSIYIHLKQLFNLIIKHRHVPYNFRQGYNCAYIIKDKLKDAKDASNYRPVTIVTILSKLFETGLFARYKEKLDSSGLQFGFVQGGGCDRSIFTISNVVNYYLQKSSDVYRVVWMLLQHLTG